MYRLHPDLQPPIKENTSCEGCLVDLDDAGWSELPVVGGSLRCNPWIGIPVNSNEKLYIPGSQTRKSAHGPDIASDGKSN